MFLNEKKTLQRKDYKGSFNGPNVGGFYELFEKVCQRKCKREITCSFEFTFAGLIGVYLNSSFSVEHSLMDPACRLCQSDIWMKLSISIKT